MSKQIQQIASADFSADGIGPFGYVPTFGDTLYAAYLLGTAWGDDPLRDISGNGRDLTRTGRGPGYSALYAGPNNYLECPFTWADIGADTADSCSVLFASKVDSGRSMFPVSNYNNTAGSDAGDCIYALHHTTNSIILNSLNNGAAVGSNFAFALDAGRGAQDEFYGFSVGASFRSMFRDYEGASEQYATSAIAYSPAPGSTNIRIGYPYIDANLYGPGEISFVAFYADKELVQADYAAAYAAIVPLLKQGGRFT